MALHIPFVPASNATPAVVANSPAHIRARFPEADGLIVPLMNARYGVAEVGVEVPMTDPAEAMIDPVTVVVAVTGTIACAATMIAAGKVSPTLRPLVVTLQFQIAENSK
jgi:hypothetical protein